MIHTATVASTCAACECERQLEVTQSFESGRLWWVERFNCECGHSFEAHGEGLPKPGLRKALREQTGTSETWVDALPSVDKAARRMNDFEPTDATSFKALLATVPARVFCGTHLEAHFVAGLLSGDGAVTRVVDLTPRS